jgi:PAS domain S-box-containing protein
MQELKLEKLLADRKNLERILDSLTEGIIAHDQRRRIIYFNQAAENITGYNREEVVGRDCHKVFGRPFCGGRCSFLEESPNALEMIHYPLEILSKQGVPHRIEMTVTGMRDKKQHLVGVLAAFRELGDLHGIRLELARLNSFAGIVSQEPKMIHVFEQIREVAGNNYPIHILGETGTGKELIATAIHKESRRRNGPFVPINCGALPEGVLESELFGHVKGAFTGAVRDKKGRFELANGGTLFLDEIADLPKLVQAKLLRVLQEGKFERVGGEESLSVDVRLISATNRDLKSEMRQGSFRADLFYRVNVVPIQLPPLRQRKGDIPLLAEHFLDKALDEGQSWSEISEEAMEMMLAYPWPGNIRELQSAIRYASVKCKGKRILPDHLPMELRNWQRLRPACGPRRKLDAETVRSALDKSGGNKAKAARLLGVGRATLYRFLTQARGVS